MHYNENNPLIFFPTSYPNKDGYRSGNLVHPFQVKLMSRYDFIFKLRGGIFYFRYISFHSWNLCGLVTRPLTVEC